MKHKKASIVTKVVVTLMIAYAAVSLVIIYSQLEDAKDRKEMLVSKVEELETSNAEMEYSLENRDDDEVIAGIARDKLGMIYPDEQIYSED